MCSKKEKAEIKDKKVLKRINKLEDMIKKKKKEKPEKAVQTKAISKRGKQKRSLFWQMKKPKRQNSPFLLRTILKAI